MPAHQNAEDKCWYVLNFINRTGKPSPQKDIDEYNKDGHHLELFAPIIRPVQIINGKVVYKDKLLTYYYVFVKGTLSDIKELCARPNNNLSLMIDHGSDKRYGMLSDAEMNNFKIIARTHTNSIPFFNIDDIDLEAGDKVEIVSGDFSGLKGTFIPKARSNKGKLVVAATANLGAVLWDIDAKYVRIIEFARDTRRQYDQLDAFIPKLLPILRKFHSQERLNDKEKSLLAVFNLRMGVVVPTNHKHEAKLLATLMCVQSIIGDLEGYDNSRSRFEKRKNALTNPWTMALVELMLAVTQGDIARIEKAYASIKDIAESPTKTQKELLEEFQYYLKDDRLSR